MKVIHSTEQQQGAERTWLLVPWLVWRLGKSDRIGDTIVGLVAGVRSP